MKILIDRKWKKDTYTIGNLYVDGKLFCNTLEDKDRGIKKSDSLVTIKAKKVYGETAIPIGKYTVTLNVTSPKYAAIKWYWNLCKGMMPRLMNVPGFDGILIHPGNTPLDTYGCILVGKNTIKGQITQSKDTFAKLYKLMKERASNGEIIELEIK